MNSADAKLLTCMKIAYLQEMCRHFRVYVRVLFWGFIILFPHDTHTHTRTQKSLTEVLLLSEISSMNMNQLFILGLLLSSVK